MHKVFRILSLAAFVAVCGCSGGNSGTSGEARTLKEPRPPATTDGHAKPVATDGHAKPAGGDAAAITPEGSKIEFYGHAPTPPHGHDGGFKKFSGSIKPAGDDLTKSTINVEIDVDSLWTDDDGKSNKLTAHLKSPDFFDVKKFPKATFVSKEIKAEKKGDDTHVITGDLTLHGTTKSVSIPAKVTTTDDAVTIDGKVTIDRTEFGFGKTFDETKLDKDVKLKVLVKAARK
jgi:polyisoprenoid-binding protein YceI